LTNQNPISLGQVYLCVKGKNDIKAVPNTQIKFPTVIINNLVFAHRVATSPAIRSEMTWRDLPAQSSKAALNVEYPRPLMMDPEKLVRTPLGTEEPNIAIDNSQLINISATVLLDTKRVFGILVPEGVNGTHFFGSVMASIP
jgi:hypothetical protein